jgi:hypothetical protein
MQMKRAVAIVSILCACAAPTYKTTTDVAPEALQAPNPIVRARPVAERAAVMLLDRTTNQGNAVLYVQFRPGSKAARTLRLDGERGPTTLRDDGIAPDRKAGDGTHSAYIHLDAARLAQQQNRFLQAGSMPIFAGRELVGTATATLSNTPVVLKDLPAFPDLASLPLTSTGRHSLSLPFQFNATRPGALVPLMLGIDYTTIDIERSLMITDAGVLDDPVRTYNRCLDTDGLRGNMGKWTFGHLMEEMAKGSGVTKEQFVSQWIAKWTTAQPVNGFLVPNRATVAQNLVTAWQPLLANGELDLAIAPFHLVAIVNRIDLGENLAFGEGDAGEARFIFATDCDPTPLALPPPFVVIFEYKIPLNGCLDVKAWAQQWKDLDLNPIGSTAYNAALEAITVQFTEFGTRSLLGQLRTNEAFVQVPWELREFRLNAADGLLGQVTVKQTPDNTLNFTTTFSDYVVANAADILAQNYIVPDQLGTTPFLGGHSRTFGLGTGLSPGGTFWDGFPAVDMPPRDPVIEDALPSASIPTPELRHRFSLNTCNGCHGGETATSFMHVNAERELSGFLTGIDVTDPAGEVVSNTMDQNTPRIPITRSFNDLLRRQLRMAEILDQPCEFDVAARPHTWVH